MSSAVGTFVKADDIVARIETDKVTVDILSAHTGVITKYHAKEGDTVPVGANFMDIDTAAAAGSAQPQAAAAPKKEASPQVSEICASTFNNNNTNRLLRPHQLPPLKLQHPHQLHLLHQSLPKLPQPENQEQQTQLPQRLLPLRSVALELRPVLACPR